jgi:putative ABC transport system permease protein
VLVLRDGARSEMESGYATETFRILAALPGVARDENGDVLASGETIYLQILKRNDGTEANVSIRAVEDAAFLIRPDLQMVEGQRFEAGKNQIIVGSMLSERYPALKVGNEIQLGRNQFRIVGAFEANGSSYESEIWGSVTDLGDSYRRSNYYSSSRLRAASPSDVPDLIDRIKAEQRLRIDAIPETEYYERQTTSSSALFVILGNLLAFLMAFGACFAAANTMYAQVVARQREIGTLRALGFRRRSILTAFIMEALVLGLLAGGVGVLLSLPLNGFTTGTMNQSSFSEVTFSLRTTPGILTVGVLLATLTALIGGIPPAWSASRRKITELLRET